MTIIIYFYFGLADRSSAACNERGSWLARDKANLSVSVPWVSSSLVPRQSRAPRAARRDMTCAGGRSRPVP